MKKLLSILLMLALLLCALPAMAETYQSGMLTVTLPDGYEGRTSSGEGQDYVYIYHGQEYYHISCGALPQHGNTVAKIYDGIAQGFFGGVEEYTIHENKTVYLGQRECRMSSVDMSLNGKMYPVLMFYAYDDGYMYLFNLMHRDGTAVETSELDLLFSMIDSPAFFHLPITDAPSSETAPAATAAPSSQGFIFTPASSDNAPAADDSSVDDAPAAESSSTQGMFFSSTSSDDASAADDSSVDDAPAAESSSQGMFFSSTISDDASAADDSSVDDAPAAESSSSQGMFFSSTISDDASAADDSSVDDAPAAESSSSQGMFFTPVSSDDAPAEEEAAPSGEMTFFGPLGFALDDNDIASESEKVDGQTMLVIFTDYDDAALLHSNINVAWTNNQSPMETLLSSESARSTYADTLAETSISSLREQGISATLIHSESPCEITVDGQTMLKFQYNMNVDYSGKFPQISESVDMTVVQYYLTLPDDGTYIITVTTTDDDFDKITALVENMEIDY